MCGVMLHAEKPSGGADRPPTPADKIQPPHNDQVGQGHTENFRNPLRVAKHQRDLLKDYFNNLNWGTDLAGGPVLWMGKGNNSVKLTWLYLLVLLHIKTC